MRNGLLTIDSFFRGTKRKTHVFTQVFMHMVEAVHAPHFLLIFKISEVRHLGVSAFSGRQEFRKAVMHLDLRSSF